MATEAGITSASPVLKKCRMMHELHHPAFFMGIRLRRASLPHRQRTDLAVSANQAHQAHAVAKQANGQAYVDGFNRVGLKLLQPSRSHHFFCAVACDHSPIDRPQNGDVGPAAVDGIGAATVEGTARWRVQRRR